MSSLPFAMSGAAGRMGSTIIRLAESEGLQLTGALEHTRSPAIGKNAFELAGMTLEADTSTRVIITEDAEAATKSARVLIDFSSPENTLRLAKICAQKNLALVVGTTVIDSMQRSELE